MKSLSHALALFLWSLCIGTPDATAQNASAENIQKLRGQLESLRQEQLAQIASIRERTDEQIRTIELELAQFDAPLPHTVPAATPAPEEKSSRSASAFPPLSGDIRIRYERNFDTGAAPDRNRVMLRARLGVRHAISDRITIAARLATGDPDDPNSTDTTLSDFLDDLSVSLDQAYVRLELGDFDLHAGKVPNTFTSTELVFDSDVNPQGFSGSWKLRSTDHSAIHLRGAYFLVQEQASGPDSALRALQAALSLSGSSAWRHEFAFALYDYELAGLSGSDSGDTRTNLLTPSGERYRSDFNLLDFVASSSFETASHRRPFRAVGNYVRNRGAASAGDTGYSLDFTFGRASDPGDLRIGSGYAVAETDAVLAAFSQDNTTLGSNYRQYSLGVDYVLMRGAVLNATWYYYRLNEVADAVAGATGTWMNRVRFNILLRF